MNNVGEGLRTPSKKPRTSSASSPSNQQQLTNTNKNSAKKGIKNAKITNFFCKVNSPVNRNNSNSNNDPIGEGDNQALSDDLSKDASSNSMKIPECNAADVAKRQLTKGQQNLNKQEYVFIIPSSDDDTNVSAKGSTTGKRRKPPSVNSNDSKSSDGFILTNANNELAIMPKKKSTTNPNNNNINNNTGKHESISNQEAPVTRSSTRGSSRSRDSLPGKRMKMDSPSTPQNKNSNDQKITRIQPTPLGRVRTKMIDFQSVPSDLNMPRDQAMKLTEKLFSVKMPEDFFLFWEFAKTINHRKPCSAFSHAHLEWNLVGPYDVLSGLITDFHGFSKDNLYRHTRFYYDSPEFQTVIIRKDSHLTHYGYYRDEPNQDKPIVVMNQAAHNGVMHEVGDNLFTLLRSELESSISSLSKSSQEIPTLTFSSSSSSSKNPRGKLNLDESSMKQTQLEKAKAKQELTIIRDKLIDFCSSHENLSCESWSRTNLRRSKICGKTLNTMGVIMPHQDETDGSGCSRHEKVSDDERSCSRGIDPTDLKLKTMLTKISDSSDDRTKLRLYKELHQIINNANDANVKCDTNVSLILGLDLFYQGDPVYHNDVLSLLTSAYTELNRIHYIEVLKAHLEDRKKGDRVSLLD